MPAACEVLLLTLLLSVLLAFYSTFAVRSAPTDEQLLAQLRARLLQSPTLRQRHPDVLDALGSWKIAPASTMSHADFQTQTLHIVVGLPSGRHFDENTLLLVLTHELVHAVLGPRVSHDSSFFAKQEAYLLALSLDGLILKERAINPAYPAEILDSPDVLR